MGLDQWSDGRLARPHEQSINRFSREAALERSPRRKPWENANPDQAPEGAKDEP